MFCEGCDKFCSEAPPLSSCRGVCARSAKQGHNRNSMYRHFLMRCKDKKTFTLETSIFKFIKIEVSVLCFGCGDYPRFLISSMPVLMAFSFIGISL